MLGVMTNSQGITPYGSATDLPSVIEMKQQITALSVLGFLVSKEQRAELKKLREEIRRITSIVDRFYELVGERNWVFTDDLNLSEMETITGAPDAATAEVLLVSYYESDRRIDFPLGRLHRFKAMQPRITLLQKALFDYREGRYYSTVLVVLSVMDGFVNDFDTTRRQGLHTRSEGDMVAWDSVAGHHLGLSHAHRSFLKGVYKTDEAEIVDLHRHGIMHGMLVNYDNKIIATKAWNRLFAVADWADSQLRHSEPSTPIPTIRETLTRWRETQDQSAKLDEWQPYEYEPVASQSDPSEVALVSADFLTKWEKRQWAPVGAYFMQFGGANPSLGELALRAKDLYKTLELTSWRILRVRHVAAAVAHADVMLVVDGLTYETDLRWIHVDTSGEISSEWEGGRWVLSMYGPQHFLKRERAKPDSESVDSTDS